MLRILSKPHHLCHKSPIPSQTCLPRLPLPLSSTPSSSRKCFSTEPNQQTIPTSNPDQPPPPSKLPIRDRLLLWSRQNESTKNQPKLLPDANMFASVMNNLSKTQNSKGTLMEDLKAGPAASEASSAAEAYVGNDESAIVGVSTSNTGDLVEVATNAARIPLLAIYLGYFGERHHFYAANGIWNTTRSFTPLFTVANFVTPLELQPILSKLPADATLQDFERLKQQGLGPSREDSKHAIKKMDDFQMEAEAIYQEHLVNLDAALGSLSNKTHAQYMSLFEMADLLLPTLRQPTGKASPAVLYAVHTALSRTDFGFEPLSSSRNLHRRDQLYEVFSHSQSQLVERVTKLVRNSVTLIASGDRHSAAARLSRSPIGPFLTTARKVVGESRKTRQITPYGFLKPSTGTTLPNPTKTPIWKDIISYLELWASYSLFGSSPRLFSTGAMILRLLELYDDIALDQSTAWTFLQEIGHIMPWEISSRYKARFPNTKILPGAGLERQPPTMDKSVRSDIAAGARQEVTAPVFCIDATSTRVVDDGISIEPTDNAQEFWIHVHAADPASGIKPNSELCKYMELVPDNIYLPGHFQAMLPEELGLGHGGDYESKSLLKQYSLQKDSRALTFSAKVNRAGDLLDYKVEPSTLRNIIYMEPDDVARFVGEPLEKTLSSVELTVGQKPDAPADKVEQRTMVSAQDLDQDKKNDLLLMYELTSALREKRLEKGAWPHFFPRPSVSIEFDTRVRKAADNEIVIPADPYIHVGTETSTGSRLVANSMVLAGEIAARWCAERQLKIPFRRDVSCGREHEAAQAYAQKELYPLIERGVEPSLAQRSVLSRLTGGIEVSAEPGPYFLLGLDMYAKATSPLRRFGDLLVHWQVHAALAWERAAGRKVDPVGRGDSVDEASAFSEKQVLETLPLLQIREQLSRAVGRGTLDWIRIAVARAWLCDKEVLPKKIIFTVDMRFSEGLVGRLDLFDLPAVMDVYGLDGRKLINEVAFGEQFEVELDDVNVYSGKIRVRVLPK